jgi:transcriptional regulator with XRE-family HTH domain
MNGQELRAWRERWLVDSQAELARLLGVHINTVSGWERNVQAIPPFLPLALETLARRRSGNVSQRIGQMQEQLDELRSAAG